MNFLVAGESAHDIVARTPALSQLPALYSGHAWARAKPKEFTSWGLLNPDLLLADVVGIVHPEVLPNHQAAFFEQIKPGR
jgi:iron complex transport system substrate-binding protein